MMPDRAIVETQVVSKLVRVPRPRTQGLDDSCAIEASPGTGEDRTHGPAKDGVVAQLTTGQFT